MIIGVSGKARSGKNTFADFLVDVFYTRFNRKFILMAFADELKYLCKAQFNLSYDQLWGSAKEEADKRYVKRTGGFWTAREIMQSVGEFYRSINYNYWVELLDRNIKEGNVRDVIVTDVRYPNEFNYIKQNNGVVIRIYRDNAPTIHGTDHPSERSLDDFDDDVFDVVVGNNGGLNDLYLTAYNAAESIISLEG